MMTEEQGGPWWSDAGEYKNMSGGMFEGTFEVDGVVLGSAVKWFDGGSMETALSSGRHQVALKPLGSPMLRPPYGDIGPRILAPNGEAAPLSRHWNISASRVGGYSHGPLGHPGDGEYDYWSISHFRLEVAYLADHLRAEVSLTTDAGRSAFPVHRPGPLPPRKIAIRLTVQRPELPAFFGLVTDEQIAELNRRLEELR
jgi:hypothetical protein